MAFEPHIERDSVIHDVAVIKPDVHTEYRGSIWTSYSSDHYDALLPIQFKHDKFSISKQGVLRGIHGDHQSWKLICCPYGDILAVIVDLRAESPTYLQHVKYRLNQTNRLQLLIPPGLGNSFYVHSEQAVYHYKLAYNGDYIDADDQFTVSWDDPRLNINWPDKNPILSERDARL